MKKNSFVFGAIILGLSGVICKVLGAIYKIPLTNILGTQGIGIYYLIFPVYSFLLSISSSSFIISLSKKISKNTSENNYYANYKTLRTNFFLLISLGFIASLSVCLFSKVISRLQGVENAYICYLVVSPAIIAVCISSVFKGYFQGLQNMIPTATSQLVEQIVKLSCGFILAKILFSKGVIFGAVGALIGLSISEIVSCIFFFVYYFIFKFKNKQMFVFKKERFNLFSEIKITLKEALPFMISSVILPLSLVIDSFLIINALKYLGFEKSFATSLWGINSGIINTLVGLPCSVISGLSVMIIPFITYAYNKNDFYSINEKASFSIKFTFLLCIPCVIVFLFFSKEILTILYSNSFQNEYAFYFTSTLLKISSINVLYLSILQITTSLLQALNKSYVPVLSLSIALIFKVIFEVVLTINPYINIVGAIISNSICYLISISVNFVVLKKTIDINLNFYSSIVCPLICSFISCFIGFLIIKSFIFKSFLLIIPFCVIFILYLFLIFILKGFSKEEIKFLLHKETKKV